MVTAGGNKFTYAAIFCAIAALSGTSITVAPKLLDTVRARRHVEEEADDKSGKTTPA